MHEVYSSEAFESRYTYTGTDLGANWTKEKTFFRVWAPIADAVTLNLYLSGTNGAGDLIRRIKMCSDIRGTWTATAQGDLHGVYYTYTAVIDGKTMETCDPYAKTTGVNGHRAMVIDMSTTDPDGWETDTDPNAGKSVTDAVIYELHIRDLSIDCSSGIQNKGKYLGLVETGTATKSGIPTGIDHMKELGITHLHILPMYDYGSVDETELDKPQFNWGYDPVNFNVPEGSYSSDPFHGEVRVAEMKRMIKGLHDNGISVVMDVVYNHVYNGTDFCFNKLVPGYFSRISPSGTYSNGSGCGNDTASERSMVRKYIVDSVKYWADEYHIDGFRFDLVGLIDTETINAVMREVHSTHPNVIFYGEGWTMPTGLTKKDCHMTTQTNSAEVPGFAFFSDTVRDLLRGSVFLTEEPGFISGATGGKEELTRCFMGLPSWTNCPTQTVNYVSCHDNNTLIDRIALSTPGFSRRARIRMNRLAAAFVLTAQGIPFFQAGEEMLRTKPLEKVGFDHNSYASSDSVNSIKWDDLDQEEVMTTYRYYQGLIAFRKAHPILHMTTGEQVKAHILPIPHENEHTLVFLISGDDGESLYIIFNADMQTVEVPLPKGKWNIHVSGNTAGTDILGTVEGIANLEPISAMVLSGKRDGND